MPGGYLVCMGMSQWPDLTPEELETVQLCQETLAKEFAGLLRAVKATAKPLRGLSRFTVTKQGASEEEVEDQTWPNLAVCQSIHQMTQALASRYRSVANKATKVNKANAAVYNAMLYPQRMLWDDTVKEDK